MRSVEPEVWGIAAEVDVHDERVVVLLVFVLLVVVFEGEGDVFCHTEDGDEVFWGDGSWMETLFEFVEGPLWLVLEG